MCQTRTLKLSKRMVMPLLATQAHPNHHHRCQTDGRSDCVPNGCDAPSLLSNANVRCHNVNPNHRRCHWHPHRMRHWAWIGMVARQWRCSCFCLESGLCSWKSYISFGIVGTRLISNSLINFFIVPLLYVQSFFQICFIRFFKNFQFFFNSMHLRFLASFLCAVFIQRRLLLVCF